MDWMTELKLFESATLLVKENVVNDLETFIKENNFEDTFESLFLGWVLARGMLQ